MNKFIFVKISCLLNDLNKTDWGSFENMDEQHPSDGTIILIYAIDSDFIIHLIDKKNDSKYRRYVAALEKCLQSFESVSEWADVISFLSRLGKVIINLQLVSLIFFFRSLTRFLRLKKFLSS